MTDKKTITTRTLTKKQIAIFISKLKDGTFFGEDKVMVCKAKLLPCLDFKKHTIINYISMSCFYNKKDIAGLIVSYKNRVLVFHDDDLKCAKQVVRILNTKYKL